MKFITKIMTYKYVLFIQNVLSKKYVLTTLFVLPSAIFSSENEYHNAIYHNINEPDVNKRVSPTKSINNWRIERNYIIASAKSSMVLYNYL